MDLLKRKRRVKPVVLSDGETVYVGVWTLGEKLDFAGADDKTSGGLTIRALKLSVCDADGVRLWDKASDDELRTIDGVDAETIARAALDFNALTGSSVGDAKKD